MIRQHDGLQLARLGVSQLGYPKCAGRQAEDRCDTAHPMIAMLVAPF